MQQMLLAFEEAPETAGTPYQDQRVEGVGRDSRCRSRHSALHCAGTGVLGKEMGIDRITDPEISGVASVKVADWDEPEVVVMELTPEEYKILLRGVALGAQHHALGMAERQELRELLSVMQIYQEGKDG